MRYALFVCTHNAGRSQMAQALSERYGPDVAHKRTRECLRHEHCEML